jgi:predicted amino acid racemase
MTKQMGRNESFCRAVMRGGIARSVAVDLECALAMKRAGMELGHIGHLVQIPRWEADSAARLSPTWWTVFNAEKAAEAAAASEKLGRKQPLLARIRGENDQFYRGHEGGFSASDIVAVAGALDKIPGGRFAGITTFPALLFDAANRTFKPTPNLETLRRASETLAGFGYKGIEINAPGTTSSVTLKALAEAGATQVEPGHGLTGTTPLHVSGDLPEAPAVVYLTEVSHLSGGEAFCFGGGLYIDPVFPNYQVKAIVAREPRTDAAALRAVEIPPPDAIDYYGMIDATGPTKPAPGDSVVFGFRCRRRRTFNGKTCRRVDLSQLRREGPLATVRGRGFNLRANSRQENPNESKENQGKILAFPWIPSAESGLFNGLQRKKIKNFFSGFTRATGCGQSPKPLTRAASRGRPRSSGRASHCRAL